MKRRTSRLLSILLALCLALALLPGTALAAESSYYDVTYPVTGGNIYFVTATGTITGCDESVTEAIIPSTINGVAVTSIGDMAFNWCHNLASITIPDSVTSIGEAVFYVCGNLTSINVHKENKHYTSVDGVLFSKDKTILIRYPAGITAGSYEILPGTQEIAQMAFAECPNLTRVTIPDSVISIGGWAFSNCSRLQSVNIPSGITDIASAVFQGCRSLTNIDLPVGVTTIGDAAFNICESLTSINIPSSVTDIESSAFASCRGLTSVTIPDGVSNIGIGAFENCWNLTSINVSSGNDHYTSVDGVLFNKDQTTLMQCPAGKTGLYTVPVGTQTIAVDAFYGCNSLAAVTIPDSVTGIGYQAFMGCRNLKDAYYSGTEDQWKQITVIPHPTLIGVGSPDTFLDATIHYNSTAPSPTPGGTTTDGGTGTGSGTGTGTGSGTGTGTGTGAGTGSGTGAGINTGNTAPSTSGITVTVNGKAVVWTDAAPFIDENDRTMVPFRAVAETIGLDVRWDESAYEASFSGGGKTIIFPIGSSTARTSEGGTVEMDTAAVIVNDRTYAPIRYLAEYFGYEVGWDGNTQTVSIQ